MRLPDTSPLMIALVLVGFSACSADARSANMKATFLGHPVRGMKSLTIRYTTAPNCTLKLQRSWAPPHSIATSVPADLAPFAAFAPWFSYDGLSVQLIGMGTAPNNSALFAVNVRDERYVPFEGSGIVGQWQLSMPPDCNNFDLEVIADAIFGLKHLPRR